MEAQHVELKTSSCGFLAVPMAGRLSGSADVILYYDTALSKLSVEADMNIWHNILLIPSCATAISFVALLVHFTVKESRKQVPEHGQVGNGSSDTPLSALVRTRVAKLGGFKIVIFNVGRLVSCLTLFSLSLHSAILTGPRLTSVGLCATFAYVSLLTAVSFTLEPTRNRLILRHVNAVLWVTWAILTYRDMLPLMTYTLEPPDAEEGVLLWIKLGVLTLGAVIVPLFIPRQYIPYDPKNPMAEPNEEQISSIFSLLTFGFVDSVVHAAARTQHLTLDALPVLSDRDQMNNIMRRSSKYIDPLKSKSQRHVFWKLFRMTGWEHIELMAVLLLLGVAGLIEPFGVNRLLSYLESEGRNTIVKPWVWIACLFLGPFSNALTSGRYFSVVQLTITRIQGIMTEVLFEHSLRVRLGNSSSVSDDRAIAVKGQTSKAPQNNMTGKINNLVTTDLNALETGSRYLLLVFFMPFQIALSISFLYSILGWSIFVGIATMVVMLTIPGFVAKMTHSVQVDKMKKSDARVQTVTEVVGGVIRMVKLFGWEARMSEKIDIKRREELKVIRQFKLLTLITTILNTLIPIFTMIVTYATYTLVMKQSLTASRVFPSMTVFLMLQLHFGECSSQIPEMIKAKVSLDRISDFLYRTELLDTYSKDFEALLEPESEEVGIRAASFTWRSPVDTIGDSSLQVQQEYNLRIEGDLFFKRGGINLVVGRTGSGKTSLLMALLGEMHYIPLGRDSQLSLPRSGGVAYHAQESWVLNDTIRNNILFDSPYDEERYKNVIQQCGLEQDLKLFEAGDETEVGERGITLSGGQKARITLARAVYSSAKILLLDDVLAALDVHTAQWIVEKCFRGDLIRGRTVILVTHNVAITAPIADFVVALRDGRVVSQGSLTKALEEDSDLSAEAAKESQEIMKAKEELTNAAPTPKTIVSERKTGGKLVVAEEVSKGRVSWSTLNLLFANTGSGWTLIAFWVLFIASTFISRAATALDNWVLSIWARQYELHDPRDVSVSYYLALYIAVVSASALMASLGYVVFVYGTLRASRVIHQLLITTLLNSTFRWLDQTPSSRIIARCTQDIAAIDGALVTYIRVFTNMTFSLAAKFGAVIIMSPIFAIPGTILLILGGWLGQVYMKAQLAVKRERSNARSPVLAHFGAAISGLVSIRAYGAQDFFRQESFRRIDRYTRASVAFYNLNRWLGMRGSILAAAFSTSLAVYVVYWQEYDASLTGFLLTMAIGFSTSIVYWVRYFNELEVQGNSLERIQQYLDIDQEPKSTAKGVPPAYWPASGELRAENLCARYSADGPEVLHNLSFHIKSGERVGIVGRTGSGKSSLTLALLRAIVTEGSVFYDNIAIDSINLDALRSNITIIPQMPELLTGTLRDNIDPFSQYEDSALNDALRSAGLFSLQSMHSEAGQLTLDSPIGSGGSNVSVGQRQIIALARAILRRSKVLILDEATSAIDYETDAVIQEALRKEVAKDATLLIVAHRLQTIMDSDRIMVLEEGSIVEFGKPSELLENKDGVLRALVDASADKENLRAMTK